VLSTGAGYMNVFHVQGGKILADFQCTADITFAEESNELVSIMEYRRAGDRGGQ
jgi:hypothetical protein